MKRKITYKGFLIGRTAYGNYIIRKNNNDNNLFSYIITSKKLIQAYEASNYMKTPGDLRRNFYFKDEEKAKEAVDGYIKSLDFIKEEEMVI